MNTSPAPRAFRLQFSLRWLLILVTLGAIVLAAYRWHWEDVAIFPSDPDQPETVHVTTYHYGWNGKPVKHGRERTFQLETGTGTENIWTEGELKNVREFVAGELVGSKSLPERGSTERKLGADGIKRYWDGNVEDSAGVWHLVRNQEWEEIQQTVAWRNAHRHGPSTWRNRADEVLQSAEFDHGRIVKWNGEPIETAFQQWLERRVPNEQLRRALASPLQMPLDYDYMPVNDHAFVWTAGQPATSVLVVFGFDRSAKDPSPWQDRFQNRVFGELLLESALSNWSTLDFRYGSVCTVRISSGQATWTDPTGTDQVRFEAGSAEEQAWDGLTTTDLHLRDFPARRLQNLFDKTAIRIDVSAVAQLDLRILSERGMGVPSYYPRPRRDVFGHILYENGYVCWQNSDGLLIVRPGSGK
jgi:hypothetical protein